MDLTRKLYCCLNISIICFLSFQQVYSQLTVLPYNGDHILNEYLINIANQQLEQRKQLIDNAIKNKTETEKYIKNITENYKNILNLKIPNSPLNAKVTGIIECEDYRIEKIIFESRSNHFVTGNLYVPTFKKGPFPAVLEACGHSLNGKASVAYQSTAILFAKNGFVAFVIDTYGQGEMLRIPGKDLSGLNPTVIHTQLEIGSILTGNDMVTFQLSNNIRAIDYLCSRPEVDKDKIGVTGNSGGGTQTLFLAGVDPRIKVAAPSCGLQTRERMFTLNGPADGCHHIYGEGLMMLEYSDYLILSAPKPILVLAGEKDDLFDINAVSRAVREAKWFYKQMGYIDRINLFTVNEGHGFHQGLREAAVIWFKKWLLNEHSLVAEPELTIQKDEDLLATNSGQVLNDYKTGISLLDINIQQAKSLERNRTDFWKNDPQQCLLKVEQLIGYEKKSNNTDIKAECIGEIDERNCVIKKIIITGRDGFPLPALLSIPKKKNNLYPAVIYLNPDGKEKFIDLPDLADDRIILAIDLRGFGETTDNPGELRKHWTVWNNEHRIAQTSLHIGKPLVGQRVQDVIDAVDYVLTLPNINRKDILLISYKHCGIIALHAAAIDSRISSARIEKSVISWMDIIKEPLAKNHLSNVVPHAMIYYDLPDLINIIKPRKVSIIDSVDAFGNPGKNKNAH